MNLENFLPETSNVGVFFNRNNVMSGLRERNNTYPDFYKNTAVSIDGHSGNTGVEGQCLDRSSRNDTLAEMEDEQFKDLEALCQMYQVFDGDKNEELSDLLMYIDSNLDGREINVNAIEKAKQPDRVNRNEEGIDVTNRVIFPSCSNNIPGYVDKKQGKTSGFNTVPRSPSMDITNHSGSGRNHQDLESGKAHVYLCNESMWTEFQSLTNEMIISRNGR